MGDKSKRKKQYIVETAKQVFLEKGFKNVTMKDIVEKCNISRGGLYLYFGSTEEVFSEVIRQEAVNAEGFFERVSEDATAAEMLMLLLKEHKKEILSGEKALTQAVYEYYFAGQEMTEQENLIQRQLDATVKIITQLIVTGVENGEFTCKEPEDAARHIMFVIEGLKITAQTVGVTEKEVDKEFMYILHILGSEAE